MMNKLSKLLIILVVVAMLMGCLAACGLIGDKGGDDNVNDNGGVTDTPGGNTDDPSGETPDDPGNNPPEDDDPPVVEFVDYASQVKFNPNSGRVWTTATVKTYVDGDTTHFYVDHKDIPEGYVKARYLAINTPESTGVIEPWGKKASNYTKGQLMQATDIIIESDTATWDLDSTGGRYLLWVWYKTADDAEYRNLNLEILQQGLAYGSGVTSCVYGDVALNALNQAKTLKLHVFDRSAKDPDYYYGGAIEVSLKELKANTHWDPEADSGKGDGSKGRFVNPYEDLLVKFTAVVAKQVGPTIYVEEYDAANDMYFGMQIFAGYSFPMMDIFEIGNTISIVGTLNYYAVGQTYQICNLKYKTIDPDWEGGCRVIDAEGSPSYREIDVNTLLNGSVVLETVKEVENEDGEMVETLVKETFSYGELAHYSTAVIRNLTVKSVWTTDSDTDSDGALTITCTDEDGNTIKIRTATQLKTTVDGKQVYVTESSFPEGTVISVRGIIDYYNGSYQIKIFLFEDVTFE